MAATPNLSGESAIAPAQSNPPSSAAASPTQTPRSVETDSPLLQQALAHAKNWASAGHGNKWPRLLKDALETKATLERIYRPQESFFRASRISPEVRKELFPSRILLYTATSVVEGALRSTKQVPQILSHNRLLILTQWDREGPGAGIGCAWPTAW